MASSMFFPLDQLSPSQILSQYSEWIYFSLILVFFISVSGITMRKHFDKPYVKPLIISVGLMLTFGVFRYRGFLRPIFEGWGILGTILLVIVASVIPFGLCRGFGLPVGKAFYLTYILFYILAWVKFPNLFHALADSNLGLVNLGFLILFFVAIYKTVRLGKLSSTFSLAPADRHDVHQELTREIATENNERKLMETSVEGLTVNEMRTVEDIARNLEEIQRILEAHRNTLPTDKRQTIVRIIESISKSEDIVYANLKNLQKQFQRMGSADMKQLHELNARMKNVDGQEKEILKKEIKVEERKLEIEKATSQFEEKLLGYMKVFTDLLRSAVDHLNGSSYPLDAKPYIEKARTVAEDIRNVLKEIRSFEKDVIKMEKIEAKLLKEEKKAT